jgi:vacuolar iron transporter family protein
MRLREHAESHAMHRIGWLRATVLGANDGIVSTASLIAGVAAAGSDSAAILVAGIAGLMAGALSMAAGEYVSVSSQSDTERADIARERAELATAPEAELAELTEIYIARGLTPALAGQVAQALTVADALTAHSRDELGIVEATTARPIQAAFASAASFAVGAAVPLLAAWLVPASAALLAVIAVSLVALAALGVLGARAGGAAILRPTLRVVLWGAVAMAVTTLVGMAFGVAA